LKDLNPKDAAAATKAGDPWSTTVEGSMQKAKARLVILGYQDPDLGSNRTWAPTLRRDTRNMILTVVAHRYWQLFTLDAKTAFLLGRPSGRQLPLFVLLPQDLEEWLGESGPRRLLKSAYGLAEAPLAWYKTLCETLQACGFVRLSSDACLFVLPGLCSPLDPNKPHDYPFDYDQLPILGIIGVHVDDLLCGGLGQEWEAALKRLTSKLKFGERKYSPVTYCGVDLIQDPKTYEIRIVQGEYFEKIQEPTVKSSDLQGDLRAFVGCLIWPATQTRPDLSFDVSWLGSCVPSPTAEHMRFAQKLLRRAKSTSHLGLRFMALEKEWQNNVLVAFSDAGWATRVSGHSQAGNLIFLAEQKALKGETARAVVVDYASTKITLSVSSSFDAELHACEIAASAGENIQATIAELSAWCGLGQWSVGRWLDDGPRTTFVVVIDAKGLWTKIQAEYKTEKRGTIYIRRLMETLTRTKARVYWVNSGHMIADGLTKLSNKNPVPNLDLLVYVLEHGAIRITYCTESWRKEMATSKAGTLHELRITDPHLWNPPQENKYDTFPGSVEKRRAGSTLSTS
jgi:hypothetical protein